MTTEAIEKRIAAIQDVWQGRRRDPEAAHILEDDLRTDFIRYVSTLDNRHLATKARLVLSTQAMDFPRWCS